MGNLCSKRSNPLSSSPDPFAQPGRVLGSAPRKPSEPRAAVPAKISSGSGGHTLGGTPGAGGAGGSHSGGGNSGGIIGGGDGTGDARSAAARAAEERAAKARQQPQGKLGKELASQKAQRRSDTLGSLSQDERMRRDADQNAEIRNYN